MGNLTITRECALLRTTVVSDVLDRIVHLYFQSGRAFISYINSLFIHVWYGLMPQNCKNCELLKPLTDDSNKHHLSNENIL